MQREGEIYHSMRKKVSKNVKNKCIRLNKMKIYKTVFLKWIKDTDKKDQQQSENMITKKNV